MIPIETLYQEARNLTTDLLPRLAKEINQPPTTPETQNTNHVFKSTPPWNSPAAMLYYEITGDAATAERNLTLALFGHAKYRAHSDTRAIDRVPVLIAHAREKLDPDSGHEDYASQVLSWARRVRAYHDELLPGEHRWAKAPGDLRCPTCENPLELPPGWKNANELPPVHCRTCTRTTGKTVAWEPNTWLASLQPEHDTHLTAAEAATEYGLAESQLRVWHHRQPFTNLAKRGGRRAYPRDQIEARLATRDTANTEYQ